MSQSASNSEPRSANLKNQSIGKTYEGRRTERETIVTVNGQELQLRLDLRSHSPTGFEWGYSGSGPAQLALAILADHFGEGPRALRLYQEFKYRVVAGFPREGWALTAEDIRTVIGEIERALQAQ